MNKEYMKPSMEIISFEDESVFTTDITVSGGGFNPSQNQDIW